MSITLKKLNESNLDELVLLFNSSYNPNNSVGLSNNFNYAINSNIIKEKIFNSPDFFNIGSFIAYQNTSPVGFICSKTCSNSLKNYETCAHICLFAVDKNFQRKGIGTLLLNSCIESLKAKNIKEIIVGQDLDNIFSGVPDFNLADRESNGTVQFLEHHGFKVSEGKNFDMVNDLSNYNFNLSNLKINLSTEFSTVTATKNDIPSLKAFLEKEFPGRWVYEISRTFNTKELEHVLILKSNEEILGFCRIRFSFDTSYNDFYIGKSCGALGPIGVAKSARGKGLGNRILYDSLSKLKTLGAKNTNIDWTDLVDFYSQFGFKPWRSFYSAVKNI